jgi:hypothetical protein
VNLVLTKVLEFWKSENRIVSGSRTSFIQSATSHIPSIHFSTTGTLSTKTIFFNRFESTTFNEMKPPKRQRKQSAKSQMTQGSGPKRQNTSNRQQRQETDGYNVLPVVSCSNTRTFTDIQTHNDGNNRQNDTSMNTPTLSTSGWPGRNPSHTQTMHDARTHDHTSAESSSETLQWTQHKIQIMN